MTPKSGNRCLPLKTTVCTQACFFQSYIAFANVINSGEMTCLHLGLIKRLYAVYLNGYVFAQTCTLISKNISAKVMYLQVVLDL